MLSQKYAIMTGTTSKTKAFAFDLVHTITLSTNDTTAKKNTAERGSDHLIITYSHKPTETSQIDPQFDPQIDPSN